MQGKSRRILILATSYLPLIGGAELAIQNITSRLPEFSFDLITSYPAKNLKRIEKIGNVSVYRVGPAGGGMGFFIPKIFLPLFIFLKAKIIIAQNSYDLIYVLQASQAGGAAWLLKTFTRTKIPLVLNLQEGKDLSSQSFLVQYFRSLIIKKIDYFAVISNYLKDFLIKEGVKNNKIFLVPNGVELQPNASGNLVKEELGLKNEKIVITVSRLVEKNGITDLIEAFSIIKKEYSLPLKLLVIGNGPLSEEIKNKAKSLKIDSDILFLGTIDHSKIFRYLAASDVFVRPSLSEGLGTAFLEAMAMGVPVVATKVGGIPDFVIDGSTGLFCQAENPRDIVDKIMMLLEDNDRHSRIATAGQNLVKDKYSWDKVVSKFKLMYESITEA